MAKDVILTPLAESNYNTIVTYLIEKWSIRIANDFIVRFNEVIGFISNSPQMYSFADEAKNVRKCILTKQNIIYFVERDDVIMVLAIFDSRQSPYKLLDII